MPPCVLLKNKWSDEGRKEIRRAAATFKLLYTKLQNLIPNLLLTYVSEAHEGNIQTVLRRPIVLDVDVEHGLCMSIMNLTNTGCSLTALQVGRAEYIFQKRLLIGVL
jgi:hypothetical protein